MRQFPLTVIGLAFCLQAEALSKAAAQILPVGPAPEASRAAAPAPRRPSPRELEQRFHRARELIAAENYSDGVRLLQSILDADEDAFFTPERDPPARESSLK